MYSDILNLDSIIRYAAIQNNAGVKIAGGFRSSVTPILSDDELQMMHYYDPKGGRQEKTLNTKLVMQNTH